jgi:hypothetical protein
MDRRACRAAGRGARVALRSMIPKSGYRFSGKIMLNQKA